MTNQVSTAEAVEAGWQGLYRVGGLAALIAGIIFLAYCLAFVFAPTAGEVLAVLFIPAAGLLFMIWHILVGWRLFQLGRRA